jgi:L-alanine-DL-glutamate epimerase-like enolase superfamily enzyme
MRIDSIEASVLEIPFKVAFKHASAERTAMQSLWVEVRGSGIVGLGEGCPRAYVTGETLETSLAFAAAHRVEWLERISDLASLRAWVDGHRAEIDANPAAWSAVEIAIVDALGREAGVPIEVLLGTPELRGTYRYTAVIGDGSPAAFEAQLAGYRKAGFRDFKIKLAGELERDLAKVGALKAAGIAPQSVRADANNLWRDPAAAIAHLGALDFPFFAIEEPLGAGDHPGMREIAAARGARIVLDESALREEQLIPLGPDAERWIVNVRISKMGGLLRSIRVVARARELGLRVIVGAHVGESSVLTRAALCIAEGARDVLVAQEGAFGTHLIERDPVTPCWMFGAGGRLDVASLPAGPGLGLEKAIERHQMTI